jgi:hypothetical protein
MHIATTLSCNLSRVVSNATTSLDKGLYALLVSVIRLFKEAEKEVLNLNKDLIADWSVIEFYIHLLQPLMNLLEKVDTVSQIVSSRIRYS